MCPFQLYSLNSNIGSDSIRKRLEREPVQHWLTEPGSKEVKYCPEVKQGDDENTGQGQPTNGPLVQQDQNKLPMQGASANELNAESSGYSLPRSDKQIKRDWCWT